MPLPTTTLYPSGTLYPEAMVAEAPGAITMAATAVTNTTASLNGYVDPNGAATSYHFEYGLTAGYGSSTGSISAGSGEFGDVVAPELLAGLSHSTTYHFRIVATNSAGTTNGADATLLTEETLPVYRVVSQPVDDRLFVDITHSNGRKSRWGPDEPDASGIPTGISLGNSAPGGHRDSGCNLLRDPRKEWPDLGLFDDYRVYGRVAPLGRSAFEGQQEGFPSELGDRFGIGVSAVGYQALLEDDESFVGFYLDRDLSHWGDPSLARRAANAATEDHARIQATAQDGLVWDLPNEALPASASRELWYVAPSGKTVASIGYKGNRTSPPAAIEAPTLYGGTTDTLSGSASTALTLDDTVRSASLSAARRYLMLRAFMTSAGTPAVGSQVRFSQLSAIANHGLTTQPISGDLPGLFGHDILHHALNEAAPLLQHAIGGSIAEVKDFVVPDFALLDPAPVSELVQKLNAYYLYPWAVWDDKTFYWQPWNPDALTWKARIQGGAHWTPAGRQASTLVNGVIVSYTDHTGKQRTAGPVGSGCDDESTRLQDDDSANPVNSHGRRRWQRLDVGFPLTSGAAGSAVQLGYVWLQEHLLPQRRGQLTVRPLGAGHVPQIEHPTLGPVPVWAVRAGDFVDLVDFPDREPFKVIEVSYDHDSKTLTATLDNTLMKLGAILERVGIRQAGRI